MQTHRAVAPHQLTLDQSATHMLGTNLASLDEIFKHVALMDYDVPGTSLEDLVSLVTQQVEAVRKDSTE
ncbi:hypothetical protein FBU59_001411 [Linderina macrospora]|uniref:Uncharacterized protein n=1 Tax=Linderina macrospora TaxID=4868 RepID=A0ACC1JE15_9FUNG|nr:hypothetical protein FBU59_001411 [Linderina macrospora]